MEQVEALKDRLEAQAKIIADLETQKAELELQKAKSDVRKAKARDSMKIYAAAHIEKRRETQRLYVRRVRAAKKLEREAAAKAGTAETA